MEKEQGQTRRIKEKLDFFFNEKVRVHISKKDKRFLNGDLLEKRGDGVYLIEEDKLGPILIFASDIYEVEEFALRKGEKI